MSRPLAALLSLALVAAADTGPLPHASGRPDGPGPGCGGGFTAARGDTLWSIARRCETSVAELVQENRLARPPQLEAGQRLVVPGFARPPAPVVAEAAPLPRRLPGVRPPDHQPPPPPPPQAPVPPQAAADVYQVQAGDTLYSLARWARTSLAALRAANPGVDPRAIEIGDSIRLPRGAVRPEPLRLRERGPVPAPAPAVLPAPPRMRPSPLLRVRPPARPEAARPRTPGGMDDGGPEPEGM